MLHGGMRHCGRGVKNPGPHHEAAASCHGPTILWSVTKMEQKGFTNPHASMDQQFFDQQLPKWNKKDPRIVYTNFGPKIKTQNDVKWPKKIGTWKFCIGTWNPKDRDIEKKDRDMRFSAPLVQGTSLYKGFWKILEGPSVTKGMSEGYVGRLCRKGRRHMKLVPQAQMVPDVCRMYVGSMSDKGTQAERCESAVQMQVLLYNAN